MPVIKKKCPGPIEEVSARRGASVLVLTISLNHLSSSFSGVLKYFLFLTSR